MEEFLNQWGYLALYVGVTLEGEAMYIAGVIASKLGHLQLFWVGVVGFLGGMTRDMTIFCVSRYGSRRFIERRPKLLSKISKAGKWVNQRPWYLLAFHRYIYGFSTATIVALSMSTLTTWRFTILCVLACLTWVVGYGLLGYFAADQVINNLDWISQNFIFILLGVLAIGFVVYQWRTRLLS